MFDHTKHLRHTPYTAINPLVAWKADRPSSVAQRVALHKEIREVLHLHIAREQATMRKELCKALRASYRGQQTREMKKIGLLTKRKRQHSDPIILLIRNLKSV